MLNSPTSLLSGMPDHVAEEGGDRSIQVKSCYRTAKHQQTCLTCGVREKYMHMPSGHVGHFCPQCCPACTVERPMSEVTK